MILLFYGSNTYALRQEVKKLIQAFIKRTGSDLGLERLDGSAVDAGALVQALQAAPFLSTSRLVIVEALSANKAAAQAPKLLERVPKSTVLVLAEGGLDRRTAYYKEMSALADRAVEFAPLGGAQLETWARKEAARLGASLAPQALRRLIELAGSDQWRLAGELGKLANYRQVIGVGEVEELVETGFSETIFNLVDAMSAGNTAAALKLYRGLLEQRTSELYVLNMIQWQLRNLLLAKAASGVPPAELAKRAGLSPYVATKSAAKQRQFSEPVLRRAMVAAVEWEYRIKRGEVPAEEGVEQLIWQVAQLSGER